MYFMIKGHRVCSYMTKTEEEERMIFVFQIPMGLPIDNGYKPSQLCSISISDMFSWNWGESFS